MSNKMDGLLELILSSNERRIYHYSSRWGTWSRVIQFACRGNGFQTIELNLTPSPCPGSTWANEVQPIIFRVSDTEQDYGDRNEVELPVEIFHLMIDRIGTTLTYRLLNEDWLSQIDRQKLRELDAEGGGATFEQIAKRR